MLEALEKAAYEAEAQELRRALKAWETEWSREHDGRKPGRDDIKRHGAIAQKYTAYNRVRGILAGKPAAGGHAKKHSDDGGASQRKRKQSTDLASLHDGPAPPPTQAQQQQTPVKRPRTAGATPRKNHPRPTTAMTTPARTPMGLGSAGGAAAAAAMVTPSISRRLFSPVAPTSIGPTPQRDGRVLGLFDVLVEEEEEGEGGAKTKGGAATAAGTTMETPLRKRSRDAAAAAPALGTTPLQPRDANAAASRFLATPSKRPPPAFASSSSPACSFLPPRSPEAALPPPSPSPLHDPAALQFATPAFLRRTTAVMLPPVPSGATAGGGDNGEDDGGASGLFLTPPRRLNLPGRKPLVRGLSSVLASLRRAEDARLDEELDLLRDLEAEGGAPNQAKGQKADSQAKTGQPSNEQAKSQGAGSTGTVFDSQVGAAAAEPRQLLGGFDDEGLYDSPPEDAERGLGRDGQPLRVFKKKGQKRTTRLSRMRPTRTRRPAAEAEEVDEDDDEDGGDIVPETQAGEEADAAVLEEDGSGSEYGGTAAKTTKPAQEKKGKNDGKKKKEAKETKAKDEGSGGVRKSAVRKVNELAHANFKRLKLRNKGTKGGPGFGSRFRRRR